MWFPIRGMPTDWVVDVWDCHGVLKMRQWGTGYGSTPELPSDKLMWLNIGYFTIPIAKSEQNLWNERLKRKIEGKLLKILEQEGGAINMSGIYTVMLHEVEEIFETVTKYATKPEAQVSLSTLF